MESTYIAEGRKHGSPSTYNNFRCRCIECREAWRVYCADQRAARIAKADTTVAVNHGKASTYSNWGCRCDECREAWRVYWAKSRKQSSVA